MTLTDLSYYIRKIGPFVALGFVFFFIFFSILNLVFKSAALRPKNQTPIIDFALGPIEKLLIKDTVSYPPNPNFILDNIQGRPTTATDSARVYVLPTPSTRFSYIQTISLMARAVGFDTRVDKYDLSGTQAAYSNLDHQLTIDIRNFNFTYKSFFENNTDLFTDTNIPDTDTIQETAKSFLRRLDRYPEELVQGPLNIVYLNYHPETKTFVVVENPQEANVVEVDFFRPDIDGFPTVTPNYFNSQNYIVMVFKQDASKVIKAQVAFFEKDVTQRGTYPIKSGDVAWEQLKQGNGYIISAGQNSNTITIREMFVAYFDPGVEQRFLQPVYVFLGDKDFVGYVPALDDSSLQKDSSK